MVKNKIKVNLEERCDKAAKTKDTSVDENGEAMAFNNSFTCLGSVINFVLDDAIDVVSRISKVRRSILALMSMCNDDNMPLNIKFK